MPKSVTFLLLIKKILTTHVVNKEKKSPLTMTTKNQTSQTMRMTVETSKKTKGKLVLVS